MASDTSIREDLLSRLADQPRYIMTGMIKISNPATSSTIARTSDPSSSLGRLDVLPLEILHYTFSMLDLRTLSSISQTCLRGRGVIKSMPEYRDLIRYAPSTMTALGLTRLIEYHSAYDLHTPLLASECASCGEFGPFLFLLACERCCYGCLWSNKPSSVKKLPTMRSLPGTYWARHEITRIRRLRLVSVKAAKELALGEGKTVRALTQNLEDKRAGGGLKDYYMRA
ncbi:hypothetical protein M409DRAFT_18058 [Zasmidium cellare ATCC 36951]|uniref:F-box domain-containing protein n=1 Tax=Zasmidium cellare ATCC 36951 TaxID=1080233 RepID=A0A6A6CXR1_ZASCE|nr:uncharacterized protein M409DRAFT_18058 [Zasmidium cellare ATCC 36951]KAF2171825.1 hypothetical protein M409DRAFT_18058 [Zasmidium cellare ATCC 36951]